MGRYAQTARRGGDMYASSLAQIEITDINAFTDSSASPWVWQVLAGDLAALWPDSTTNLWWEATAFDGSQLQTGVIVQGSSSTYNLATITGSDGRMILRVAWQSSTGQQLSPVSRSNTFTP